MTDEELIKLYEEENPGKHAIWRGKETKGFQEWLEEREEKSPEEEKEDSASEEEKEEKESEEEASEEESEEDAKKEELKGQKVKEGDMVKVDIFGKTVEDDPEKEIVFQASNQEDAKKLLSYEESKASQYVPELAIVGEKGFIMDKIDEILPGMKYFEEKVLELDAEDAFGKREGKKIKRISTRKYRKNMNEPPKLGATYKNKKGEQGRVIKIGSGRVFLDFNHPLAGKDVEYRVKVVDKIEDFKDQVRAFIERRMPGPTAEMMELDLDKEEKTLFINIPQNIVFQMAQQQGGIYFKMGLAYDLQEFMDDVDVVKFVETYEKPESHDHDHDHDDEHVDVEEAEEQIEIDESEEDSE